MLLSPGLLPATAANNHHHRRHGVHPECPNNKAGHLAHRLLMRQDSADPLLGNAERDAALERLSQCRDMMQQAQQIMSNVFLGPFSVA